MRTPTVAAYNVLEVSVTTLTKNNSRKISISPNRNVTFIHEYVYTDTDLHISISERYSTVGFLVTF